VKQRLQSLLDAYEGPVDLGALGQTVKQELAQYVLLSGVNPILVPTDDGVRATPPSRFAQIHFVKKWGVNAITALAEEQPVLLVFAGTPFALVDYFNRLLAHREVLADFDASSEIAVLEDGALKLDFDYSGFISDKFPDSIPLTAVDVPNSRMCCK
jgi:hypothetical protein